MSYNVQNTVEISTNRRANPKLHKPLPMYFNVIKFHENLRSFFFSYKMKKKYIKITVHCQFSHNPYDNDRNPNSIGYQEKFQL